MINIALLTLLRSSLTPDLITILVGTGDNECTWTIHQDLLCASSPFFAAAINGAWRESHSRTITFPTVSPTVFTHFANWLYFRRTPSIRLLTDDCLNCGGGVCQKPLNAATIKTRGWTPPSQSEQRELDAILAAADSVVRVGEGVEVHDVPLLREAIVSRTWWFLTSLGAPPPQEVLLAFQCLPSSSPLLKLLTDAMGMHFEKESLVCVFDGMICERMSAGFWFRMVCMGMNKAEQNRRPKVKSLCKYHEYAKDEASKRECLQRFKARKELVDLEAEFLGKVADGHY